MNWLFHWFWSWRLRCWLKKLNFLLGQLKGTKIGDPKNNRVTAKIEKLMK